MKKDIKISDDMKFDVRIVKKLIREEVVDAKEYQKFLKDLPDESKKARDIEVFTEEQIDEETPLATDRLTFTS